MKLCSFHRKSYFPVNRRENSPFMKTWFEILDAISKIRPKLVLLKQREFRVCFYFQRFTHGSLRISQRRWCNGIIEIGHWWFSFLRGLSRFLPALPLETSNNFAQFTTFRKEFIATDFVSLLIFLIWIVKNMTGFVVKQIWIPTFKQLSKNWSWIWINIRAS